MCFVVFGLGHVSLDLHCAVHALATVLEAGVPARLVLLGPVGHRIAELAGAIPIRVREKIHAIGFAAERVVSRWLSSADVFLAPYVDGASTRRGTLAAALAHGLPVLTTLGPNTERPFFDGSFARLVESGDRDAFAAAALELATDPQLRRDLSRAALHISSGSLDWRVLADRVLDALCMAARRSPRAGIIRVLHGTGASGPPS